MAKRVRKQRKQISPVTAIIVIAVVVAVIVVAYIKFGRPRPQGPTPTPEYRRIQSQLREALRRAAEQGRGPLSGQPRGPAGTGRR